LLSYNSRRYETGHWDAVIVKYKESELFDESSLSETSRNVLAKVRRQLSARHLSVGRMDDEVRWLPCHVIDLHADGELNGHVDSVRFSGDLVSGLSLLSSSIMRLRPATEEQLAQAANDRGSDDGDSGGGGIYSKSSLSSTISQEQSDRSGIDDDDDDDDDSKGYVDLLLPPLSLYVLSGAARYRYTHELLPSNAPFKDRGEVVRDHRLSIIFRDEKCDE